MKLIVKISVLIVCSQALLLFKAQAQAPKYVNEFLSIGAGARQMAMGGAVVAHIDDATASYWNPAGLASNYQARQFIAMHANYFSNLAKYDYAGLAMRLNHENAIGISFLRFAVDDIPNTLNLIDNSGNIRYDLITSFSAADHAFVFSYGRQTMNESFKFGMSIKLIRRVVGDFASSWGFGGDIGIQKHVKDWHFGLMVKDATTTFNAWKFQSGDLLETFTRTGNLIPSESVEIAKPLFIGGFGKEIQIKRLLSALVECNLVFNTDGERNEQIKLGKVTIAPSFGLELNYGDRFFFRSGINNFQKSELAGDKTVYRPALGAGINFQNFTLDYAITDIGSKEESNLSNVISLKIDFDKLRF